ncbi:MAG: hypothetical protein SGJ17_00625 [Hyphomicrobiales bacterium]|nr:hypothetical protein [Hyphomicrobiales bacterium]
MPSINRRDSSKKAREHKSSMQFAVLGASLAAAVVFITTPIVGADQGKSKLILGNLPPNQSGANRAAPALDIGEEARLAQAGGGFTVRDTRGAPGTPIPLLISLPSPTLAEYTFVMLRGVGKAFKLSAGFQTKDAWAVSLRDLPGLTLISPPDFNGVVEMDVQLIKGRDVEPETRRLTVTISRSTQPPYTAGIAGAELRTASPTGQIADPLALKDDEQEEKTGLVAGPKGISEAEETAMISRANLVLKNSDVSAARLLFEHLARRGSAKAAFAMGQTYDPEFLKTLFVKGLKADIEKAKAWYRRSVELGGGEAQARLSALDADK